MNLKINKMETEKYIIKEYKKGCIEITRKGKENKPFFFGHVDTCLDEYFELTENERQHND